MNIDGRRKLDQSDRLKILKVELLEVTKSIFPFDLFFK